MSEIVSLLQHKSDISTSEIGTTGEKIAVDYFLRHRFLIVCTNFKTPIGRNRKGVLVNGEIDLIAFEEETLCFIEVKTKRSDDFAAPISAINLRKQRQIIRTAKRYRKIFHLENTEFRYDAIGIVLNEKRAPKIEHFRGFFDESKFMKNNWTS